MPEKYLVQRRTASGLETVAELPMLDGDKIDISLLPVVGTIGSAIIERGSNANGEYVKFADGTMHCWSVYIPFGSDPGVMQTFTYPAAFAAVPIVLPSVAIYTGDTDTTLATSFLFAPVSNGERTTYCQMCCQTLGGNTPLLNGRAKFVAIGRWK